MSKDLAVRILTSLWLASLVSAPGVAAPPALTLDLATLSPEDGLLRRIYGANGSGRFGVPVAGGADADGDGKVDYAVSYMTASPLGRQGAGEVALVFGTGELRGSLDTAVPDPSWLRIVGAGVLEAAGNEIWLDDVTGDGFADLLICRQNFKGPGDRVGAGALTLVVGGPELRALAARREPLDLAAPPAELTLITFVGAHPLDRLGIWARTGDVSGDGVPELVVAADQEDAFGESNRGAVYVIRGGPHLAAGGVIDLARFGATPLEGHLARIMPPAGSAGFHLGATCQVADLDANGRAEVLAAATLNRAGAALDPLGAPGAAQPSGGAPGGALYIVWDDNFPEGPWPPGFTLDLSALPGGRSVIRGDEANVSFGEEILGGLDYDGDGAADLFVGDLVANGATGLGHILFGAAGLKDREIELRTPPGDLRVSRIFGPSPGALAADTAAHGDFNGDGLADLAFASPHGVPAGRVSAGIFHIFFGQRGPWPARIETASGLLPPATSLCVAEIWGARGRIGPGDEGDTLGYSAVAGDIDGDGRTDLIANEMVGNGPAPGREDVGNLILLSGAAFGFSTPLDGSAAGRVAGGSPRVPGSRAGLHPRRIGSEPPPPTTLEPARLCPPPAKRSP